MNSHETLHEDSKTILRELSRLRDQDHIYIMPNEQPKQTIILLGRTGVGKTTISKVIENSLYCPSRSSSYHQTEHPFDYKIGGLHIVDTPDIFDHQNRLNKCEITDRGLLIGEFQIPFTDGILPLFGLVLSIQQGISSSDITAILNFKTKFARFSRKMVLVLTHCEEKTEMQRHALINEFFDHSRLVEGDVRHFFERGVLFMGCIRCQSLESGNRNALMFEHNQVLEMRAEFIRRCQENESVIIIPVDDTSESRCCSYTRRCCYSCRYKCLLCLCISTFVIVFFIYYLPFLYYDDEHKKLPEQ